MTVPFRIRTKIHPHSRRERRRCRALLQIHTCAAARGCVCPGPCLTVCQGEVPAAACADLTARHPLCACAGAGRRRSGTPGVHRAELPQQVRCALLALAPWGSSALGLGF